MKYLLNIILASLLVLLSGCGSDSETEDNSKKNSDTTLSDYKKRQLDKAKAVEEEMNKRIDNIDKQLDNSSPKKDDDNQ